MCSGLLFQFLLALFVFRSSVGHDIFQWMSNFVQGFLGMARHGMAFLTTDPIANLPYFAVVVFPAVIFFSAVVQMLYHLGALQWISTKFAVIFIKLFQVSGVEAIVAAASVSNDISEAYTTKENDACSHFLDKEKAHC